MPYSEHTHFNDFSIVRFTDLTEIEQHQFFQRSAGLALLDQPRGSIQMKPSKAKEALWTRTKPKAADD